MKTLCVCVCMCMCMCVYLQVSTVHSSSATHGQKAGDGSHVNYYVYRNSAFVGRIQQVSKNIHICKRIHHYSNHLHKHTHKHTQAHKREIANGVSLSWSVRVGLIQADLINCLTPIILSGNWALMGTA